MLGNKYNHSIDFRKGKLELTLVNSLVVGCIHRYLQAITFLNARGVLFYILRGLINIVLLQSKPKLKNRLVLT